MHILHTDVVSTSIPHYDSGNPIGKLLDIVEQVQLCLSAEHYDSHSLQYLIPIEQLQFYPPRTPGQQSFTVEQQDNKLDEQQQNLEDFICGDSLLVRGWGTIGDWEGPFLKIGYRGGPDSRLSKISQHQLDDHLRLWIKVNENDSIDTIKVPYNPATDHYEVEIWGCDLNTAQAHLDEDGHRAVSDGALQFNIGLLPGVRADFYRENIEKQNIMQRFTHHAMHPVRPMKLQLAWCDHTQQHWDSRHGDNYHYQFSMLYRGWDHFLGIGTSDDPHGGRGFLHYRNLFSNYRFKNSDAHGELNRQLQTWNRDAFGRKGNSAEEPFFAVEYMDLHIIEPKSAIGLHRHRDNQEAFFNMRGSGLMIIGDWCRFAERERCFEIRTLTEGHLALLKGGQLHSFCNISDEPAHLFIFGGYD